MIFIAENARSALAVATCKRGASFISKTHYAYKFQPTFVKAR
jgi:hypothetical protein